MDTSHTSKSRTTVMKFGAGSSISHKRRWMRPCHGAADEAGSKPTPWRPPHTRKATSTVEQYHRHTGCWFRPPYRVLRDKNGCLGTSSRSASEQKGPEHPGVPWGTSMQQEKECRRRSAKSVLQIVSVVEAMDILSGGAPRFGLSSLDLTCLLVLGMNLMFFIVCWDRIQGKKGITGRSRRFRE